MNSALFVFTLVQTFRLSLQQEAACSASRPQELTTSGSFAIPNLLDANCGWRIVSTPKGTVDVKVVGSQRPATDVITLYDGYDTTANVLISTSYISAGTVSLEQSSTQRYLYVSYTSTTSYGNYTVTYTIVPGIGEDIKKDIKSGGGRSVSLSEAVMMSSCLLSLLLVLKSSA